METPPVSCRPCGAPVVWFALLSAMGAAGRPTVKGYADTDAGAEDGSTRCQPRRSSFGGTVEYQDTGGTGRSGRPAARPADGRRRCGTASPRTARRPPGPGADPADGRPQLAGAGDADLSPRGSPGWSAKSLTASTCGTSRSSATTQAARWCNCSSLAAPAALAAPRAQAARCGGSARWCSRPATPTTTSRPASPGGPW